MKSISGFFSASVLLLYFVFCGVAVSEPSFNCNLARTNVEKMICADDELSAYDRIFSQKYREFLQKSKDVESLKISQFQWLKSVRNLCDSNECLKQAYHQRYLDLRYGDDVPDKDIQTLGDFHYRAQKIDRISYLESLHSDDDWLTGVWTYDSDSSMALYALFEKNGDGYTVKYNYPRYAVTWWTGKVVREGDVVKTWHYRLDGDKVILPKEPTIIEEYKAGQLVPVKSDWNMSDYYGARYPADKGDFEWMASSIDAGFVTGESHIRNNLKRIKRIVSTVPYIDALNDSKLIDAFQISEFRLVASLTRGGDRFYLAKLSITDGAPHSGYCGAGVEEGFYWYHVVDDNKTGRLASEWSHILDTCRDSVTPHVYHKDREQFFLAMLDETAERFEDNKICFQVAKDSLQEKPAQKPCIYPSGFELW